MLAGRMPARTGRMPALPQNTFQQSSSNSAFSFLGDGSGADRAPLLETRKFSAKGRISPAAEKLETSPAFTLLEVMLAVMIMALIGVAIYRFVLTDLEAIHISTEDTARKGEVQALIAVLGEEFCNLPTSQQNAFSGEAHKFNQKASDQVEWLTQAGNGLFTQAAQGQWKVTLILRPQDKGNTYTLGLLRQLTDANSKQDHWLPLLMNVDAIEIRYFDPRLNAWLEKWSDAQSIPSLVRVRIWRTDQTVPYEAVIELPPTKLPS
jgi:type II secretion system protein J